MMIDENQRLTIKIRFYRGQTKTIKIRFYRTHKKEKRKRARNICGRAYLSVGRLHGNNTIHI
jgi:hypothetical protein